MFNISVWLHVFGNCSGFNQSFRNGEWNRVVFSVDSPFRRHHWLSWLAGQDRNWKLPLYSPKTKENDWMNEAQNELEAGTYITMLLLDEFEERRHVRPAKMVDGF